MSIFLKMFRTSQKKETKLNIHLFPLALKASLYFLSQKNYKASTTERLVFQNFIYSLKLELIAALVSDGCVFFL